MIRRLAAGTVGGLPIGPVDPRGVDVTGADVDVDRERHDRHLDVARRLFRVLERGQEIMGGFLECRHLAARRHRSGIVERQRKIELLMPQTTSPLAVMSRLGWPIRRQNMVAMVAEPDTFKLKLPCWGELNCWVTWTLLASGRSNIEVK